MLPSLQSFRESFRYLVIFLELTSNSRNEMKAMMKVLRRQSFETADHYN